MTILSSHPAFYKRPPRPRIIEEKRILTQADFLKLDIVDWTRRHPHITAAQAMDGLCSWFVGTSFYQIIQTDLYAYPEHDGFPGWTHVGHHERMGKRWWNHFHYEFNGELSFGDSPDFKGKAFYPEHPMLVNFWGDIGRVSPLGLRTCVAELNANTIWISVVSNTQLVFIATPYDLGRLATDEAYREACVFRPHTRKKKAKITVPALPSLWDNMQ